MRIEIPGFETRGVWEITRKVGNLSGIVNLRSDAIDGATGTPWGVGHKPIGEKVMHHYLTFGHPQKKSHEDAEFFIRFTNLEDIFAIESVFAELARLIPLIESGEVVAGSEQFEIYRKGALFAFKMDICYWPGEGEQDTAGLQEDQYFAGSFRVYVITPNGDIEIGQYDLYYAMDSALRIAHDFAVMRALIDGRPESEILAMKPLRELRPRP
jgi:hypothetical protein